MLGSLMIDGLFRHDCFRIESTLKKKMEIEEGFERNETFWTKHVWLSYVPLLIEVEGIL
jgi:hypothetical protein